ncbi:MAG: hypothetical protein MRY63_05080 [Neomegalonema sp.]|nr:hypothetical protein [Neomegalonema sp.]
MSALPEHSAIEPFRVALTSCGRFDLLRATVASLLTHLESAPRAFVIVEDSGKGEEAAAALAEFEPQLGRPFTWLVNDQRQGQMRALERLYDAIGAEYVFHCEDDWLFTRGGFLAPSFRLLKARPDASLVSLRAREQMNRLLANAPSLVLDPQNNPVEYFEQDPGLHPEYFGYSFNPGLRRLSDLGRIGRLSQYSDEAEVSLAFKQAGFRIVNLEWPAVEHIGDGRHVADPTRPPKPRGMAQRLQRSVQKRWRRLRRRLAPPEAKFQSRSDP